MNTMSKNWWKEYRAKNKEKRHLLYLKKKESLGVKCKECFILITREGLCRRCARLKNIKKFPFITKSNTKGVKKPERAGSNHHWWKGGIYPYRKRAVEKYGLNCNSKEFCPLKGIILPNFMYEVDHKDGNHKNNKLDNLQVLCVWCHRDKTIKNKEGIYYDRK